VVNLKTFQCHIQLTWDDEKDCLKIRVVFDVVSPTAQILTLKTSWLAGYQKP
jgi:hypothetical protein